MRVFASRVMACLVLMSSALAGCRSASPPHLDVDQASRASVAAMLAEAADRVSSSTRAWRPGDVAPLPVGVAESALARPLHLDVMGPMAIDHAAARLADAIGWRFRDDRSRWWRTGSPVMVVLDLRGRTAHAVLAEWRSVLPPGLAVVAEPDTETIRLIAGSGR